MYLSSTTIRMLFYNIIKSVGYYISNGITFFYLHVICVFSTHIYQMENNNNKKKKKEKIRTSSNKPVRIIVSTILSLLIFIIIDRIQYYHNAI